MLTGDFSYDCMTFTLQQFTAYLLETNTFDERHRT